MTRDEEIARANEAQRLLGHPLMLEVWGTVEAGLMDQWKKTFDAQERERERIWLMLRLLAKVKATFEGVVEAGKFAVHLTEQENRGQV